MMQQIILIIHVIVCVGLIGLILIQHGKGAEVGASFGSGASQTIFGSQGSASFISRATAALVALFFMTSLGLGYLATESTKPKDLDVLMQKIQAEAPAPVIKDDDVPKTPSHVQSDKHEAAGKTDLLNLPAIENPTE